MVKGESVFRTILSKFWFVFPLMVFLNSSISFLISLKRSELASSGVLFCLLLLSLSLPLSARLLSCSKCCFISWFYLVSSSTVADSDWICRANAAGSGFVLVSIWTCELTGTDHVFNHPYRRRQTDDAWIVS